MKYWILQGKSGIFAYETDEGKRWTDENVDLFKETLTVFNRDNPEEKLTLRQFKKTIHGKLGDKK